MVAGTGVDNLLASSTHLPVPSWLGTHLPCSQAVFSLKSQSMLTTTIVIYTTTVVFKLYHATDSKSHSK